MKLPRLLSWWSTMLVASAIRDLSENEIEPNVGSLLLASDSPQETLTEDYMTSDVPSDTPSWMPSDIPSSAPSDSPSLVPSTTPSTVYHLVVADEMNTDAPSDTPSMLPSDFPSSEPSHVPSDAPSLVPSQQPSATPSTTPTWPSLSPTSTCHDMGSYRSPLNNFECSDHRGTDCTLWRYLGLSVEEVLELLQNCPESCQVDCVDLVPFDVALTFGIQNVPSFLGPASVAKFEDISVEYLNNYVSQYIRDNSNIVMVSSPEDVEATGASTPFFFLHHVELLSQQISGERRYRKLREGTDWVNLVTTVLFTGYAVGFGAGEPGVGAEFSNDSGYESSLSLTEVLSAGVSSSGFVRAIQRSGDQSLIDVEIVRSVKNEEDLPGRLPPGSVHRRSGAGVITASIATTLLILMGVGFVFYRRTVIAADKTTHKQVGSGSSSVGALSPRSIGQLLSFESFRQVLSSPRNSGSRTSVEGDSSGTSIKEEMSNGPASDEDTTGEEDSDDGGDNEEEKEHPLSGVVPPMIVYDNIDDFESEEESKPKFRNIVPSLRVEATADILESLRSGKVPTNFRDMSSSSDTTSDDSNTSSRKTESSSDGESKGSLKREQESVRSAPEDQRLDAEDKRSDLRKCTSDPARIEVRNGPPSASNSVFPLLNLQRKRLSLGQSLKTRMKSPLRSTDSPKDTTQNLMQTLFLNPAKKAYRTFSSSSSYEQSPSSPVPPSLGLGHTRSDSRGSEVSLLEHQSCKEDGSTMTFHVPRHGKPGLVLECDIDGGVLVRHVKDYSPLLGKVKANDRVLKIDGVDVTSRSNLDEVTTLLGGKAGRWPSQTMKIVVGRIPENNSDEDMSSVLEVSADSEDFLEYLALGGGNMPQLPDTLRCSSAPSTSTSASTTHKRNNSMD